MARFTERSHKAELMDDLRSSGAVIDRTLRELEIINKVLGGNRVTIGGLKRLLNVHAERPETLTIVDLGCGGGDMLKIIAGWGRKTGQKMQLIGIDANPNIIAFAQKNTRRYAEISYKAINIFSEEFKTLRFDIVISTLFTHHFTDKQLVSLFHQLGRQAGLGMVINDLHRHWFAYHAIKLLTAAFSRSEMVRHDAAVSVLRAFRKNEMKAILKAAGIVNYKIQWMWAFRWQVVSWYSGNGEREMGNG